MLSQIYGPKKTWTYFMGSAALTSFFIPIAAHVGAPYGMWIIGALNFVSGLGQGTSTGYNRRLGLHTTSKQVLVQIY